MPLARYGWQRGRQAPGAPGPGLHRQLPVGGALQEMKRSGTRDQIDRLTRALLPMKRLGLAALEAAYLGTASA